MTADRMPAPIDPSSPLASITVPWGRQQVTLQEIRFDGGGLPLLRVRIREGRRFTVFDIDAQTARQWGGSMQQWAARQLDAGAGAGNEEKTDEQT
jgi:hypothetical protein